MSSSPNPVIAHAISIKAEPSKVWQAILDPDTTREYFYGLSANSDWVSGARLVYEDSGGVAHLEGRVLSVVPGETLVVSIRLIRRVDSVEDLPSRITWRVENVGEGWTRLTVTHDEFDGETATYRRMKGGWPTVLAGLKEVLESGGAQNARATWPTEMLDIWQGWQ